MIKLLMAVLYYIQLLVLLIISIHSNTNNTFSFSKINQDTSRDSNGFFSSKNPNNDNHTYFNGGKFAGLSNNRQTNEYSSTSHSKSGKSSNCHFFTAGAKDDDDYNAFFGSDEETARTTNHNLAQDKNTLAFIFFSSTSSSWNTNNI
ncbi:unnamed protein product [Rotaria socialis]|uniref:Uncharacterized protein n=1 Tax=Rotaria socialis TaxID=392032 RepID=A0A821AP19_9BILA|nr:unnamed protein product [Rotaria socialis]CAF4326513.1 unnamed protein product [Rotaria socialis]CAF4580754.1 unnamed protein product [Rotaria socialis]CAF4779055.1 unnamed protein product [Rotaria socialis]